MNVDQAAEVLADGLADRARALQLADAARRTARGFTWDRAAEALERAAIAALR